MKELLDIFGVSLWVGGYPLNRFYQIAREVNLPDIVTLNHTPMAENNKTFEYENPFHQAKGLYVYESGVWNLVVIQQPFRTIYIKPSELVTKEQVFNQMRKLLWTP